MEKQTELVNRLEVLYQEEDAKGGVPVDEKKLRLERARAAWEALKRQNDVRAEAALLQRSTRRPPQSLESSSAAADTTAASPARETPKTKSCSQVRFAFFPSFSPHTSRLRPSRSQCAAEGLACDGEEPCATCVERGAFHLCGYADEDEGESEDEASTPVRSLILCAFSPLHPDSFSTLLRPLFPLRHHRLLPPIPQRPHATYSLNPLSFPPFLPLFLLFPPQC